MFTRARHWSLIWANWNAVYTFPLYYFKAHFNIILSSSCTAWNIKLKAGVKEVSMVRYTVPLPVVVFNSLLPMLRHVHLCYYSYFMWQVAMTPLLSLPKKKVFLAVVMIFYFFIAFIAYFLHSLSSVSPFVLHFHPVIILSRVGWYSWRKWLVLVRMIGFISTFVTNSLNHPWIQRYHWITHTGPLLVTQLIHRDYNSLTESHAPNITHE
jgi:hypothetical protein